MENTENKHSTARGVELFAELGILLPAVLTAILGIIIGGPIGGLALIAGGAMALIGIIIKTIAHQAQYA